MQEPMRTNETKWVTLVLLTLMTAGQRLQHDITRLAATVSCPGPDPAAVTRGQAAIRTAMVLSDLFARADARAGELAKAYDQARIAGQLCEASYNALTK